MLKAYMVHDGEPSENAALVFAHSDQEARKLGHGWENIGCDGFLTVRAKRMPDLDKLAREGEVAYVEHKSEVLHLAGWRCEGDEQCAACELYEMDGKYPVCDECGYCSECGHDKDCPNQGV